MLIGAGGGGAGIIDAMAWLFDGFYIQKKAKKIFFEPFLST